MLEERIQKKTLVDIIILPNRPIRKTSREFTKSKARLKKDGHFNCYICGSKEELEVHHYGCEYALAEDIDLNKLKTFCEEFDVYGYGKLLRKVPMASVDDIRNLMVLCEEHHIGGKDDGFANGIHNITFPTWIIQKLSKDGIEPVPDKR